MENQINISLPKSGDYLTDDQAMNLAIQAARLGAPFVSPNPLVGCVVLDDENQFLSLGYHEKYGESHAEINAIKNLTADQLLNAKLFVTLEPCAHQGKTGSCAKKLTEYKINKVIYGLTDPNPLVAGRGAQILMTAGIRAEEYQGLHKQDLENLAEVFLKNFRHKKTFVAMKVASSMDGQMALKTGESQWITGPESREYVHELRSWYDAVLVGQNTIELDNPSLNIRHPKIQKNGKLIIIDHDAKIIKSIEAGKKYKFIEAYTKQNIYFATQADIIASYQVIQFFDLDQLMEKIWNLDIKSIFIEGGSKTYSSFLVAGLIDRVYLFMNASVIGAKNGLSWTTELGIENLKEKLVLKDVKSQVLGSDIFITGKL